MANVKVGFSLSSKKQQRTTNTEFVDDADEGNDDNTPAVGQKEFVVSISGNEIQSAEPKTPAKPLVISMEEQARVPMHPSKRGSTAHGGHIWLPTDEKYDAEAFEREAKAEAAARAGGSTATVTAPTVPTLAPPTSPGDTKPMDISGEEPKELSGALGEMLRNRIVGLKEIEDEDARFKYDVESRPELDDEAYQRMPIEAFGEAALRGMGWVPGVGLGPNQNGPVQAFQPARPHMGHLGLGCSEEAAEQIKRMKKLQRKGITLEAEQKELERGTLVALVSGSREGTMAVVKESGLSGQVLLRLQSNTEFSGVQLGASEVWVGTDELTVVDPRSLAADHPALAFWKKMKEDKSFMNAPFMKDLRKQQQEKEQEEALKAKEALPASQRLSSTAPVQTVPLKQSSTPSSGSRKQWVRPHLTVRLVSKSHKKFGQYFKQKATVVDVPDPSSCVLQVGGTLLEGVSYKLLETVIPPVGGTVMVVSGTDRGRTGKLVKRQGESALVQMDGDINTYRLDDVCQYTPVEGDGE